MSKSFYLTLKNINVQHANAMPAWNVIGSPAVTAHLGFAGAVAHRYGADAEGVAILHLGMELEGMADEYGKFNPNRVRGLPTVQKGSDFGTKSSLAMSDQPGCLAAYECSLIIQLPEEIEAAVQGDLDLGVFEGWMKTQARLAGGVVQKTGEMRLFGRKKDAIAHLGLRGHWVLDRADLIETRTAGEDQLDAAIRFVCQEREPTKTTAERVGEASNASKGDGVRNGVEDGTQKSKNASELAHAPAPRYALNSVGYRRITNFESREGARKGLPHAYVETLLGLIEYAPARTREEATPIFWSFCQPDDKTFVGQAKT
jgi:hypothetical protein